jgi:hypothetical protein
MPDTINVRTLAPTPAIAALIKNRSTTEQVSGPAVICAIITAFVDRNHDAITEICDALDNVPPADVEKIYFKLPADVDSDYGRICALMGNRKSDLTAALLILVETMSADSVNHRKALSALCSGTKKRRRTTDEIT